MPDDEQAIPYGMTICGPSVTLNFETHTQAIKWAEENYQDLIACAWGCEIDKGER